MFYSRSTFQYIIEVSVCMHPVVYARCTFKQIVHTSVCILWFMPDVPLRKLSIQVYASCGLCQMHL